MISYQVIDTTMKKAWCNESEPSRGLQGLEDCNNLLLLDFFLEVNIDKKIERLSETLEREMTDYPIHIYINNEFIDREDFDYYTITNWQVREGVVLKKVKYYPHREELALDNSLYFERRK